MKPLSPSSRQFLLLLGVGVAAVATSVLLGFLANLINGNGGLVGLPFGQAIIFVALFHSDWLGLPKINWGKYFGRALLYGILTGGLTWALATSLSFLWAHLLQRLGLNAAEQSLIEVLRTADAARFAFITLVAGFVAPAVEEIYFRGWWQEYALGRFKGKSSKARTGMIAQGKGIFCVAFVFAALHFDLAIFPGLLLAGILFGIAVQRWGLHAAIAAHTVFNLMTIVAARAGWM